MTTTFAWCFLLLFLCFIRLSFAESPATRKTKQQVEEVRIAIEHSTKKNNIAHTKKHGSAPLYHYIGCFLNSPVRTLSYSGDSFRSGTSTQRIIQCALVASNGGYNTFGVQHGGNCFTGRSTRNKHGVAASGCKNGLGGTLQSDIYILHTSVGTPKLYLSRMESSPRGKNGKILPWCGNTPYNPQTLQCCLSGQLVPHNYSCTPCGKKIYDENKFICCKGKYRLRRKYGLKTKCCGEKRTRVYNINRNICCGNRLLSKRLYGCCGNVKYRKFTHKCCGIDKIILRSRPCNTCNRKKYSPRRYICSRKTILLRRKYGAFTKCCGAGVFHSRKSICCYGTIQPLRYGNLTRCCRKKIFNMRLRKCCRNGKNVPRHSTCTTCAGRQYNPKRQICCRSSGGKQTLKFKTFGTKTRCCGNNVYNRVRQKCCFSTVRNWSAFGINKIILRSRPCNTCNGKKYSPRRYICCRKTILLRRKYGVFTRCCGAGVFHSHKSICCYGTIQPLRYGILTRCCRKKIYTMRLRKYCKNGKNVPRHFTCTTCAGRHYNPKRQICCRSYGGKETLKLKKFGTKTRCCQNNVYNPELQKCCFSTVHNQPALSSKWKCCGANIYNSNVHRCCRGRVKLPKLYSCVACAMRNFYDPRRKICCRGIIYRRRYGLASSCCVKQLYDKKIQKCCSDGTLIPSGKTCSLPLCGKQPYNETSHICCDGHAILERKFGTRTGCCHYGGVYNVYNIYSERCCYERPIPIMQRCQGWHSCEKNLDVTKFVCCAGKKVYKKYGFLSRCCGLSVYHPVIQICCAGSPAPKAGGRSAKCCGQRSYNSDFAKCCPGNYIVAKCEKCP